MHVPTISPEDLGTAVDAIRAGEGFLARAQDPDGCWRDFEMPPGASEAWTTAVVGCALAADPVSADADVLRRAGNALVQLRRPNGWSYNRKTAVDADSTAWAWLFLKSIEANSPADPSADLHQFVGDGGAHTFLDAERFGTWAAAHADVTPIVGLAFLGIEGESITVARLRAALLEGDPPRALDQAFWWRCPAYCASSGLTFLAKSGGIPREIQARAAWLVSRIQPDTPFTLAHCLNIDVLLGAPRVRESDRRARQLAALADNDGTWPASDVLLEPDQFGCRPPRVYSDVRRIFGTATAVIALKQWLCARLSATPPSMCSAAF